MPKVTLKVVNPYPVKGPTGTKIVCNDPRDAVIHSELISVIMPYYSPITQSYINGINVVYIKDTTSILIVKQPYSQLVALMNENAYAPVSVGTGDTVDSGGGGPVDDGGNTGGSGTPAGTFVGSLGTTFNGGCLSITNQNYKHNGSGALPVAGNKVFLTDGTTLLANGYYGINSSGTTPVATMKVNAGYVQTGWPISCTDLQQIYE
jgi:hypothetical protein